MQRWQAPAGPQLGNTEELQAVAGKVGRCHTMLPYFIDRGSIVSSKVETHGKVVIERSNFGSNDGGSSISNGRMEHSSRSSASFGSDDERSSSVSATNNAEGEARKMPADYQLRDEDIILGRGKGFLRRKANTDYLKLLKSKKEEYVAEGTKSKRTSMLQKIVQSFRAKGIFFVSWDKESGQWWDIGDKDVRYKMGHCIRDLLKNQGRPMRKAKTSSPTKNGPSWLQRRKDAPKKKKSVTNVRSVFATPKARRQQEDTGAPSLDSAMLLSLPSSSTDVASMQPVEHLTFADPRLDRPSNETMATDELPSAEADLFRAQYLSSQLEERGTPGDDWWSTSTMEGPRAGMTTGRMAETSETSSRLSAALGAGRSLESRSIGSTGGGDESFLSREALTSGMQAAMPQPLHLPLDRAATLTQQRSSAGLPWPSMNNGRESMTMAEAFARLPSYGHPQSVLPRADTLPPQPHSLMASMQAAGLAAFAEPTGGAPPPPRSFLDAGAGNRFAGAMPPPFLSGQRPWDMTTVPAPESTMHDFPAAAAAAAAPAAASGGAYGVFSSGIYPGTINRGRINGGANTTDDIADPTMPRSIEEMVQQGQGGSLTLSMNNNSGSNNNNGSTISRGLISLRHSQNGEFARPNEDDTSGHGGDICPPDWK